MSGFMYQQIRRVKSIVRALLKKDVSLYPRYFTPLKISLLSRVPQEISQSDKTR